MNMEEVKFSVQGSLQILPKQGVLSIDWMPAHMIQSELRGDVKDGIYYIDCDPASFRLLYLIGKGDQMDVNNVILDSIQLNILHTTAEYLGMVNVANEIRQMLCQQQEAELAKRRHQNMLKAAIESGQVRVWQCTASRAPQKDGPCANTIITMSRAHEEVLFCTICSREFKTSLMTCSRRPIESLDDFYEHLQRIL